MPGCYSLGSRIRSRLRDYDRIQDLAVVLIYIQIGCALIGSLSALFNGVLLINLVVALFALVTIESSSQSLGRTYAVLLFCAIVLDVAWFILFSQSIWNFAPEKYGSFFVFSLRLALSMQIIGFSVRFLSSFLWIQMYRLGPASVDNTAYCEVDFDVRSSFLNPPAHEIARQNSNSDDFIGGAIYDPAYYSSLFEDGQDKGSVRESDRRNFDYDKSVDISNRIPSTQSCISRSFQVIDNWAAFEPPKTTVKRSMQVQRSRVTADKPFLKAKKKFDSQIEKFAIQQKSNATRGSSSSEYHLNEGILDGASKLAVEAHSNLGSKWAKDISGSPHILGLKSHPEVGMERTSTVPPSMSPSLSRISSSQSSTKELFDSPDLLSIEATQSGYLSKPLATKTVTNPRNTSSTFSSSISPINTRPVVVAKDQASKTLDLTSGGIAPTLSMPGSTEHLADTSGSVSAVTKENNFSSPFTMPAFASAGLSGKTTEFNNMTTGNQSSDSTLNLAFQSKVSVPTSSSPPPFFSSKPPEAASMTPSLTPASLAPISFGKSSLSSKPTGITNQTASVSTSTQSSPSSSPVSNQSQNSVIQINTTLTPNSSSTKPFVMSSFDAKSGVSNQLASVSSLTSSPSGTLLSHAQKSSSTTFTSLSPASRSSTVTEPTPPVTSATVGSVHLDKVNLKSQPTESTASEEVVSEPKNESNLLRTSSDSTSVAESLSQPEIPSSTTVLSTSTEKYERLDISLSQEDEMEEEASDTTTLSLRSLGGFGLGSMPSSSASKPNPFGVSFLTANSSTASPPLTLAASAGAPFRLASFSLPSAQPVQTSQPASSGGFSSGFGQPAQVGVGQQAFGSVLGSFGQSQQLGSGMPAIGFPSSSGFSGGGFSPAASTGGFAGAATGGGFTSATPAGGGFAAAAKGGGFAGLASSGGFAGAAARGGFGALPPGSGFASAATAGGGFGALPPGSGFASTATAGGGFGGAGTGAGFASGGFAAFGSNQGGGFAGFGGNNSAAGAGKPPAALLTQMRK